MELTLNSKWQNLLDTPGLTDIVINGSTHTYIDVGFGLERVANPFASDAELVDELIELGYLTGNRIDVAKPISDFSVNASRFHAVLPFGVSTMPLVSIRKHPNVEISLEHLVEAQMISEAQLGFLDQALSAKKNILVAGPTSAGKTTLLSALLARLSERAICLEQIPELYVTQPAISLTERVSNQEGQGSITMQQLVIEALRMRPDRIVVGEVRGSEFGVLLQAMNNGHAGAMTTLHARRLSDIPARLMLLGQLSNLSSTLTSKLVSSSFDLALQVQRIDGKRVLSNLGEFTGRGLEIKEVQL
jgi:pilus assembly protein CpaF